MPLDAKRNLERLTTELGTALDGVTRFHYAGLIRQLHAELLDDALPLEEVALRYLPRLCPYAPVAETLGFMCDFERPLWHTEGYRSHFCHQLYVFLLGCRIIDANLSTVCNLHPANAVGGGTGITDATIENLQRRWFLMGMGHDIAYALEDLGAFLSRYSKVLFRLDEPILTVSVEALLDNASTCGHLEMIRNGVADMVGMTDRIDRDVLYQVILQHLAGWPTRKDARVVSKHNHSVASALAMASLLTEARADAGLISEVCAATCLHDWRIWRELSPRIEGERFYRFSRGYRLDFAKAPLAYLLVLCDYVQDWGRHPWIADSSAGTRLILRPFKMDFSRGCTHVDLMPSRSDWRREDMEDRQRCWRNVEAFLALPAETCMVFQVSVLHMGREHCRLFYQPTV